MVSASKLLKENLTEEILHAIKNHVEFVLPAVDHQLPLPTVADIAVRFAMEFIPPRSQVIQWDKVWLHASPLVSAGQTRVPLTWDNVRMTSECFTDLEHAGLCARKMCPLVVEHLLRPVLQEQPKQTEKPAKHGELSPQELELGRTLVDQCMATH